MASISFFPSQSGNNAIQNSDFENGFSINQNGNVFSFTGNWNCPATPPAYTQSLIAVCQSSGNCAVITAAYTFNGSTATVTGSMTVDTAQTPFSNSGIAAVAPNGNTASLFLSNSAAANTYLSAPFLLGHLGESTF